MTSSSSTRSLARTCARSWKSSSARSRSDCTPRTSTSRSTPSRWSSSSSVASILRWALGPSSAPSSDCSRTRCPNSSCADSSRPVPRSWSRATKTDSPSRPRANRFRPPLPLLPPLPPPRSPLAPRLLFLTAASVALLATAAAAQGPFGNPAPVPSAPADTSTGPAPLVGRIMVKGNAATDSARIVRTFEVVPGSRFSLEAVQRGIRKLFTLGLFSDAWVERLPRGSEVDLVIHVIERPRIASIAFSGNKKRGSDDLEKKLFLHAGEPYDPVKVQTQIDTLVQYYHDQGFGRAAIAARADSSIGGNRVKLTFAISEGERVRI